MNIKEIYDKFDKIGSLTFATIDKGYPETRIAHFFAYDEQGLYFRTMFPKPFYEQLIEHKKVSVCGMFGDTSVSHDEEGLPLFKPGYTIRVSGDVREVSIDEIKGKKVNRELFHLGVKDVEKYPAMRIFLLHSGKGEIFDYDFEMELRNHKLLRENFTINSFTHKPFSLEVRESCIGCGRCLKRCSFKAISNNEGRYEINRKRCDVCGDCIMVCPVDAIKESVCKTD